MRRVLLATVLKVRKRCVWLVTGS